jgi:hypothetical protein
MASYVRRVPVDRMPVSWFSHITTYSCPNLHACKSYRCTLYCSIISLAPLAAPNSLYYTTYLVKDTFIFAKKRYTLRREGKWQVIQIISCNVTDRRQKKKILKWCIYTKCVPQFFITQQREVCKVAVVQSANLTQLQAKSQGRVIAFLRHLTRSVLARKAGEHGLRLFSRRI